MTRWLIGGIGTLIGVAMTVIMSQPVDTHTDTAYPAPVVEQATTTPEAYPVPPVSWPTPTLAPMPTNAPIELIPWP